MVQIIVTRIVAYIIYFVPIVRSGYFLSYSNAPSTNMVLPTPQALTLTSIVIGVATTAMLLSFCMVIYRYYGTLDARKIRRLRE